MALTKENIIALAKATALAKPGAATAYSFGDVSVNYQEMSDTLRKELQPYAGTYALFRENKNFIFTLMEDTIDEYLPKKVLEQYGQFAETKTFGQGDKPVFTQKITQAAKKRAKQFITKVGLAGIYEVFKLDGKHIEVPTSAFGGAAQIGFEEFLDGRVDFADVLEVVMEGLDDCIYLEIERALKSAVVSLQAANKASETSFVETKMDNLIAVASAYGEPTIYCTREFAYTMIPQNAGWISDNMKNERWNNGYLANYKGTRVIILDQSFEDDTNSVKVIDPSYAWVIPTGAAKPVKIAFEGATIVRDIDNADMSKEIQIYKKFGVACTITNNICVYRNTSLTREV